MSSRLDERMGTAGDAGNAGNGRAEARDRAALTKDGGEPADAIESGYHSTPPAPAPAGRRPARLAGNGRRLAVGLAFIAPNILGFLAFTLLPLIFAMILAFTNWDLALHNDQLRAQGEAAPLKFVGLGNFVEILTEPVAESGRPALWGLLGDWQWDPDFWKYFGNTLFFMMALPIGIGLALLSAMGLSKNLGTGDDDSPSPHRRGLWVFGGVATALLLGGGVLLTLLTWSDGPDDLNGMPLLFCAISAAILLGGVAGGQSVYRTLFYMPHFVAGVATFLLWKKIFNTQTGPLTNALRPPLALLADVVNAFPAALVSGLAVVPVGLAILAAVWALLKMRRDHRDGDLGTQAALLPAGLLLIPGLVALGFYDVFENGFDLLAALGLLLPAAAVAAAVALAAGLLQGQIIPCPRKDGAGATLMFGAVFMVLQFVLLGFGAVVHALPGMAADGLAPPQWLSDVNWAKPSIMLMGLWAAIGGQTMLLYVAALTNVPQELYEAADIDGAGRFNKFWNVTWPQLAPTTFFVVVMGVIGGLQGGFEMARVMTQGGPAGQTTTLSYYIFEEGFENTRLAFASAASWVMFFFVFTVTLFNWKFGNQYVND